MDIKILHITTIDVGGAYKAAQRIRESLQLQDIDSTILFRNKTKKSTEGIEYIDSFPKYMISKLKNGINLLLSRNGNIIREALGSDISGHPSLKEADVIVLHWVNSFLSPKSLKKILSLGKPVVWIMHDMWPYTGGCHCDMYCGRYRDTCKECPLVVHKWGKSVSSKNFKDKQEVYNQFNFYVIGPSRCSVKNVQDSQLLKNQMIYYIPNCINTKVYYPRDKDQVKRKLQLPLDKKIVLFGADNAGTEDKNKGFAYLLKALKYLDDKDIFLLIFGRTSDKTLQGIRQNYQTVGYIENEDEMSEIYSAADVMVTPSIQESFGFTCCEALACGIPVTAFGIGGLLDQIEHKKNGYLAELYNSEDLARGISYCISHSEELGQAAYKKAQQFSYEVVGKQYKELFESAKSNYYRSDRCDRNSTNSKTN